jgi:hypothetical protein
VLASPFKSFYLFRSKHEAAKQNGCMVMAVDVLSDVHFFNSPQRKGFSLIIQNIQYVYSGQTHYKIGKFHDL